MSMDSHGPVLIVGAGPTGLVVAIELARRGIPFHLIDRQPEPARWSQAIFIKSRTLEILAALGLRDRFYAQGRIVNRVEIYADATMMASYAFAGLDSPFPHILSIAEEETIRILTDKLLELGGTVERGVEFVGLNEGGARVRARLHCRKRGAYELEAGLVVGCDGYHSAIRDAIGDAFDGRDYPELWGVFDTGLAGWTHPRDTVCAQLEAPIAIPFPLGDHLWRIYFRTETEDPDARSRVVERLRVLASDATLADPGEPQFFHSHSRLARRFRIGRVFLAGDAAHGSNPIEGHGMNAGIQDAWNLGWKLAAMASGRATEALIDSYEAERRPADETLVQSGDEAYARMQPTATEARQALFSFLSSPEGPEFAARAESEITLGYDKSPIVETVGPPPAAGPLATMVGYRVGDVDGLIKQGRPCTLHDLLATTGSTVLVLIGATPPTDLSATLEELEATVRDGHHHLQLWVVVRGEAVPSTLGSNVLLDPTGRLHQRLGAEQPRLCVIRPDGHLGLSAAPPSAATLRAHLQRLFPAA